MYLCLQMCGGQKSVPGVCLIYSTFCFLRGSLFLNFQITESVEQVAPCLLPSLHPQCWVCRSVHSQHFYVGTRNQDSDFKLAQQALANGTILKCLSIYLNIKHFNIETLYKSHKYHEKSKHLEFFF